MTKATLFGSCVLLATLAMHLGGCDAGWGQRGTALETRTFALQHMEAREAVNLIVPYVYTDRVGAPGMVSEATGDSVAITVRETVDNLNRIASVLSEFDRPAEHMLALKFQLISPNGSEPDPEIADVVTELRRFLRFDGYSLAGETFVSLARGSFEQSIRTEDATYRIDGYHFTENNRLDVQLSEQNVRRNQQNVERFTSSVKRFETSVIIQPGKTLVLGSITADSSTAILVVRSLVTDQVDG